MQHADIWTFLVVKPQEMKQKEHTRGAMNPMSKATTAHQQAAGQKEPGKGEELGNLKQLLQKRSTRTLDLAASGFVLDNFTKSLRNYFGL